MDVAVIVILTALLAFLLFYTYWRAYTRGYNKGYGEGAVKVLEDWRNHINGMEEEMNG